jgi:hypothetical protein
MTVFQTGEHDMQEPDVAELNEMSGEGLVFTLGELPKEQRSATLKAMDDAAVRRYVHSLLGFQVRYGAWRVGKWLLAIAVVCAFAAALHFAMSFLLATIR